ncbi:NB-ARC domain-containing protein [Thioalkalivibrio sp. AKL10]|uniref:NB-ARC domain-containing protein n=1 Tax=Thioalkalivibrio sp. AKL10 TaxID=1158158 RepID=UPI0003A1C35E|nr:NB-ARC domain-containing protein [Thioalkalivibrio sp. AKL10]
MNSGPLLEKIRSRVTSDKEEGDIAYFYALSLEFEYLAKLTVLGVVACLRDDADRNRYSIEYDLIRCDSIGEWVRILNSTLTGPAAQFFIPTSTHITRDLTERVKSGDWRYELVSLVSEAAAHFGLDTRVANKVALRQSFELFSSIRNRTRGHGATTTEQCSEVCPKLEQAIDLFRNNHRLFQHDWAHLHRNLSKKYRVSALLGECADFEHLKSSRDEVFSDGVYISLGEIVKVPLLFTNTSLTDICLPNGNYKAKEFETLSYITNEINREDGSIWSTPPGRLPPSHTEGKSHLDQLGSVFTNLPEAARGYVPREDVQYQLKEELLKSDRHPIITLTGPGGIGKTSLALAVIGKLANLPDCPYEVILWLSSRDVDLLDAGPKPVTPSVVNKGAIAESAVDLLEPSGRHDKAFNPQKYFEESLSEGAAGTTLLVLDNFETVESPADVFNWIDTFIRPPNKVLITTRFRDFHGDYPIEVGGMTDSEAMSLITQESRRLGVAELLSSEYTSELIDESDGHPYVMKMLLGQVAMEGRAVKPERIVAGANQLLVALFERTYEGLSPAAQRIFLLLSSWRVFVPAIAVEAVALRPGNERFDVQDALDELRRFSLTEEVCSSAEEEVFVGIPLAAASFGRRKLEVSPFKVAVEQDRKLLMEFGAGDKESSRQGVMPRIDRLVSVAARQASDNPDALEIFIPVLEFLGSRIPKAYLRIAQLLAEGKLDDQSHEKTKGYVRRYLESADKTNREEAWFWLADLCHESNDAIGEIHALGEIALLPATTAQTIGIVANRMNNRLRELKERGVEESWSDEVGQLIERVAQEMERQMASLDATDCSRLAWLYLNTGHQDRARDIARKGIEKEPYNEYCLKLVDRLEA